ncbi:hypothetical protein B4099_1931 [Heyndrickxia coagulans]|uniref:Uncharacterized protein n=1 Tax=Heyndrickxia coagulans TaxID=1398 RepID=A0A150JZQ3_HEYCO|nr:hypothetical protein B4099_1931 [Heyndrickxia coagulans]
MKFLKLHPSQAANTASPLFVDLLLVKKRKNTLHLRAPLKNKCVPSCIHFNIYPI